MRSHGKPPTEFSEEFLAEFRELLLSTSVTESYNAAGEVTGRKDTPFLGPWRLLSLGSIDASDFGDLVQKRKSRQNRIWNSSRYGDLAVHLSILIEEQVLTREPAGLTAHRIRICSPQNR